MTRVQLFARGLFERKGLSVIVCCDIDQLTLELFLRAILPSTLLDNVCGQVILARVINIVIGSPLA